MKEKINELAIQAKIQMVSEPRLEEFTQLIVAECIKAIEEVKKHPPTTYELDMMDKRLLDKCIDAIKDKFE